MAMAVAQLRMRVPVKTIMAFAKAKEATRSRRY
jgi:hypothetical protein